MIQYYVASIIALVAGVLFLKNTLSPSTLKIRARAAIAQRVLELACNALLETDEHVVLAERIFFFNRSRELSQEILCSAAGFFVSSPTRFFAIRAKIAVGGNDENCMIFPARITVWIDTKAENGCLKGCYNYLPLRDVLEPDSKKAEDNPPEKIRF